MDIATLFCLSGKRALVTGGASGIGLAITEVLAAAGAAVLAASHRALPSPLRQGDRRRSRRSGAREAWRPGRHPRVERRGPVGVMGAAAEADYLRVFEVNLHSASWLAAAVAPGTQKVGGGAIVLMASLSAMRGNRMIGPYAMSKAAPAQLARNLAVEYGPNNIRANAIAPGLIETPFSRALMSDEVFMACRLAATPRRRVGQPSEIAATTLWLVSPGGVFTTGQTIVVDGGTLIGDGS